MVRVSDQESSDTMTLAEFESHIEQLSLSEQLVLLERLSRQIRNTLEIPTLYDVRGILRTDHAADDEALHEQYTDYLEEKYR
jgi:hypothetical protein